MTRTIAQKLMLEHQERVRFSPVAATGRLTSTAAAYDAQREFVSLLAESAKVRPVGYKVGLTSDRMQKMCNINEPIAGVVLSHRVHRSGAKLASSSYQRLGFEFEIAVQLAIDIDRANRGSLTSDPWAVVSAVCPAIELVDDRDADYATLDVLSLIADNSWNAGIVLGDWQAIRPDLADVEGTVYMDDSRIDSGWGRDVLGHPFRSVAWLSDHLLARGEHLRAGDIVLTGSLVNTRFPKRGHSFRFSLAGIGTVEASVTEADG